MKLTFRFSVITKMLGGLAAGSLGIGLIGIGTIGRKLKRGKRSEINL